MDAASNVRQVVCPKSILDAGGSISRRDASTAMVANQRRQHGHVGKQTHQTAVLGRISPGNRVRQDGGMHRTRLELDTVVLTVEVDPFIPGHRLETAPPWSKRLAEDDQDRATRS